MVKIGIVGCGVIGKTLAHAIEEKFQGKARLAGLCDVDLMKAESLSKELKSRPRVLGLDRLIWHSHLIIEAASAQSSADIARRAVRQGRDVMVMSVGGILRDSELFELARKVNRKIYIPSGAIGGIDSLKAARFDKLSKVILITKKPPQSFSGAPYIIERNIDLGKIEGEVLLFEGTADEAIKGFPQNINVSAILSLAGLGFQNTSVRIVTSPQYTRNIHEIEFEGSFGKFSAKAENLPMPENPKTSYLAALSAIATLDGILSNVKIGT
jgi:aspartate dehydrogenase